MKTKFKDFAPLLIALGGVYYLGSEPSRLETTYTPIKMINYEINSRCYKELFVDHDSDGVFDEYVQFNGEKDCVVTKPTLHLIKEGLETRMASTSQATVSQKIPQISQIKYNLLVGHWK